MSDDEVQDEGGEAIDQGAIDDIMGDGGDDSDSGSGDAAGGGDAGGGDDPMNLQEIEGSLGTEGPETEYAIGEAMAEDVTAIYDIPVQISAVLGRSTMQVSQLLKLGRGAVVELDRKVGEAIDIYVNNRLVARGEVVVVEEKLGVTMTEIVKSDRS